MTAFLDTLVQLSLAGSLLGLTVWAATLLLKTRLSKAGAYALWLLVLLRLLLPMGLPGSPPALLPEIPLPTPVLVQEFPLPAPVLVQDLPPETHAEPSATPEAGTDWTLLLPWVWGTGALLALAIPLVSYARFLQRVRRERIPPEPRDQALLDALCP